MSKKKTFPSNSHLNTVYMTNEYVLEVERPVLRNLKFFKNLWGVIQIILCGGAAFTLTYAMKQSLFVISGEGT